MAVLRNIGSLAIFAMLIVGLWTGAAHATETAPIETRHFRFHAVDGSGGSTDRLAETAERRFLFLCSMLDACDVVKEPIDVYLAPDPEAFAGAFPHGSPMAEWAVGVAFIRENRIVLRAHGSALFSLDETFDHEVSHILVHSLVGDGDLPRWLSEGVAIWQAGESVIQRLLSAQRATLSDSLLSLESLTRSFPRKGPEVSLAYAQSALFVRWLETNYGRHALPSLLKKLSRGRSIEDAFLETFGESLAVLESRWKRGLEERVPGTLMTLIADPNVTWIALSLLFVWTSWIQLRRRREQLDEMAEREAQLDAAFQATEEPEILH